MRSFIIHELIHTNWNPISEKVEQRSRFFDEGITQYFTYRILSDVYGVRKKELVYYFKGNLSSNLNNIDHSKLTGIKGYSLSDLGYLSYNSGPLFLIEIEDQIGKNELDKVLKKMLLEYKEKRITFKSFEDLFKGYNVKNIIDNHIYTDKFIRSNIK